MPKQKRSHRVKRQLPRSIAEHWHLDKRVPIALILTLATQTGAGIWWAGTINNRVSTLEQAQAVSTAAAPGNQDRLTRVEVKVESVQTDVTEIKSDIKRLIQR